MIGSLKPFCPLVRRVTDAYGVRHRDYDVDGDGGLARDGDGEA